MTASPQEDSPTSVIKDFPKSLTMWQNWFIKRCGPVLAGLQVLPQALTGRCHAVSKATML